MNTNNNEMLAYIIIKEAYDNDSDELVDSLYHYMHSHLFEDGMDMILYGDEIENYLGFRGIQNVVNYIIKNMRR